MAQVVVDLLEAIQVEVAHGQQRAGVALAMGDGLAETVGKQHAIGQPGQHVVVRHHLQRLLLVLALGDIRKQPDEVQGAAVIIVQGGDAQQLGIYLAGFLAVPDFTLPVTLLDQGLPHVAIEFIVMLAGLEQAR
ncbi:hypothetical protein GALL_392110 [mine drainage metagenome]|uniref:Uncharacterized protein n=1 Tax=mine drainage metagenome TaxID=410659 RepID=A0A1J5QT39_9ZZZZ